MLTGENGLLRQAENAKIQTEKAGMEEAVDIAMAEYYMRKNAGENITLGDFLNEKVEAGEFDNVTDNEDGTYTVEKDGYEVIVSDNGRQGDAQKAGARPTVENVKVVLNSDGTGANLEEGTQPEETKLYINFGAKIEGGTITSVTCDSGTEVKLTNGTYTTEVSKNGKYKFTIVGKIGGEEYTTIYTVEVKQYENALKVGDYVEYDVTYTDMYCGHEFTAQDGWRVLESGEENPDGTYSGVKLISTGIPANIDYAAYPVKDYETDGITIGKWLGTREQRQNFVEKFEISMDKIDNENVYEAAGLYYNFKLIKFTPGENPKSSIAGYKKINGKTSEELNGKAFLIENIAENVHNLTLAELNYARGKSDLKDISSVDGVSPDGNDAAEGLFYLRALKEYNNTYSTYLLSYPSGGMEYILYKLRGIGDIVADNPGSFTYGLRPVISLKDNIKLREIEK